MVAQVEEHRGHAGYDEGGQDDDRQGQGGRHQPGLTGPPVRRRSERGPPTGYQRRRRIEGGHSSGAPDSVRASPREWISIPGVTPVPSQPAVPAMPPGTR